MASNTTQGDPNGVLNGFRGSYVSRTDVNPATLHQCDGDGVGGEFGTVWHLVGGGGAAPVEDTYANILAASPTDGTLGIPTNDRDALLVRASGAWRQMFRGRRVLPPGVPAVTINAPTVVSTALGQIIRASNASVAALEGWATEWAEICVEGASDADANTGWGVIMRDSVADRYLTLHIDNGGGGDVLNSFRLTAGLAFGAQPRTVAVGRYAWSGGVFPTWLLRNDAVGSTVSVGFSAGPGFDPTWISPFWSEAYATWLTNGPDQVGVYLESAPSGAADSAVRWTHIRKF